MPSSPTDTARTQLPEIFRARAFFGTRELQLVDPRTGHGFALKFSQLASRNGFQRTAETLAIWFQRRSSSDISKLALRQSRSMDDLTMAEGPSSGILRLGESTLSPEKTQGSIIAAGKKIEWDLKLQPVTDASFNAFPNSLKRLGLFKTDSTTEGEDLCATGTILVDGVECKLDNARGILRSSHGPKLFHSWAWGHCNSFVDERGEPSDFLFEGVSGRARLLGALPGPRFASFYFRYKGQPYTFNTAWSSVRLLSKSSLTRWTFRADRGDLSFRGELRADHRDFAGLTTEDTDGSLAYSALSLISNAQIHVYRRGKLDTTLTSNGGAALEVVSRRKNRYVPLLL